MLISLKWCSAMKTKSLLIFLQKNKKVSVGNASLTLIMWKRSAFHKVQRLVLQVRLKNL